MTRFPLRTLILMIVALIAFVRLYCATHPRPTVQPQNVKVIPADPKGK